MAEKKKFEEVSTPEELIDVLETRAMGRQNTYNGVTKYVLHYTKLSAVEAIMKNKKWYIGSPRNMNDGLELIHLEDAHADNLFFASFCLDDSENIGMWSMYAQPWEDGVLLRIPLEKFKDWIKSGSKIHGANKKKEVIKEDLQDAELSFHAVAYTNAESKDKDAPEILRCGDTQNTAFTNITEIEALKGYIKDEAWKYENEYRIRVETHSPEAFEGVAIEIPKVVLESFEFITGPRFDKNFKNHLRIHVDKRLNPKVTESLFTGRLKWVYCDSCKKS